MEFTRQLEATETKSREQNRWDSWVLLLGWGWRREAGSRYINQDGLIVSDVIKTPFCHALPQRWANIIMCTHWWLRQVSLGAWYCFHLKRQKENKARGHTRRHSGSKPPARVCCSVPSPYLSVCPFRVSHREGISVTEIFDLTVPGIIEMIEPWLRKRISLKQIKVNGDCGWGVMLSWWHLEACFLSAVQNSWHLDLCMHLG